MDQQAIDRHLARMREEHPESFSHPQAREGEVYVFDILIDVFWLEYGLIKKMLPSARAGEKVLRSVMVESIRLGGGVTGTMQQLQLAYLPIFANAVEFAQIDLKKKLEKDGKDGKN